MFGFDLSGVNPCVRRPSGALVRAGRWSERSGRPSSESRQRRDGRPSEAVVPRSFLPSIFFSIILASLFLLPSSFLSLAAAAEFRLVPSLAVREEYDDNIFFAEKNKVDDFITTLTPGLELQNRTENSYLSLLGRLDVLKYADNQDLDNVDQNYSGKFSYSPHPNWTLSIGGGFVEDSRVDRDLEITGLVTRESIRRRQNYLAGVDHNFSETTKVGLTYAYIQEDYSDFSFADLKEQDAGLSFVHDLGRYLPNVSGRMNFAYSRYEYDLGTIDYFYATIGINWALSEKWSLLFDGGGSYTVSESGPLGNEQKEKDTGWVGMGNLSYKGEKTTGDLTFSHRVAPASGTVGVTTRTSMSLGVNRRFTYEFSGGLSVGYFFNKAEKGKFSTVEFDEETLYVTPRVRYEFTRDIALEGFYKFSFTKDKASDTEARRNLVMLRLYIQYPLFE